MRLVWTLVLQLSYLTMAIPSVAQEGESILEPPRERFERSISEQEERVKELLDNFKAEMLGKFQEQDRRIAAQQKTIEEQNETIQMILTHLDLLQDSGPSSEAEESLLLLTGGSASDSLSSVEVFPRTSGCSPPDLPAARHGHTTFLTAGSNPVIATCGGVVGRATAASCLVLDQSNHRWDETRMGDLTMPRKYSAVATLNSVGVFIIGGQSTNNERTSDFLAAGQMQWQEGPALPVDMVSPCVVTITPTNFLAIEGADICEFDAAIDGPTSINGWREAGRLKTNYRVGWPGCAKIGQKVIIAGGYNNGEGLRSSEVLDLDSREITAGGDMASPRRWFHLATIRRGGQEKVFAVGGSSDDRTRYLNTVEELVEEEESTTWATADSFLGERRGVFGALALPEEFLCPA